MDENDLTMIYYTIESSKKHRLTPYQTVQSRFADLDAASAFLNRPALTKAWECLHQRSLVLYFTATVG